MWWLWFCRAQLKDVVNKTWYIDGECRKCIVPVTNTGAHVQPWGYGKEFGWDFIWFRDGGVRGLELVNKDNKVIATNGKWDKTGASIVFRVGQRSLIYSPLPKKIPLSARVCSVQNNIALNDPFRRRCF